MPGWISPWEIILLVFILLIIFGPKRLPGLGKSLGQGMRNFKDGITGKDGGTERPAAIEPPSRDEPAPESADRPVSSRQRDT